MAKNKAVSEPALPPTRIEPTDLEIGHTYMSYVGDLVKILDVNLERKEVAYYNLTGVHKQWTNFKNVNLVKKVR